MRARWPPASLTRLPSGARLPRSACSAPVGLNGASSVKSTSPSGAAASRVASASVEPSTVGASPSTWPPRTSSRISAAVPPTRWRSSAMKRPDGREARDHRRAAADRRELVERQRDAGFARDREQVEDAVRRAAGRGDARHRVQERAPVEEASRGRSAPASCDGERARARRRLVLRRALVGGDRARRRSARCRGSRARPPSCSR